MHILLYLIEIIIFAVHHNLVCCRRLIFGAIIMNIIILGVIIKGSDPGADDCRIIR